MPENIITDPNIMINGRVRELEVGECLCVVDGILTVVKEKKRGRPKKVANVTTKKSSTKKVATKKASSKKGGRQASSDENIKVLSMPVVKNCPGPPGHVRARQPQFFDASQYIDADEFDTEKKLPKVMNIRPAAKKVDVHCGRCQRIFNVFSSLAPSSENSHYICGDCDNRN